jgi:hypothetical protein
MPTDASSLYILFVQRTGGNKPVYMLYSLAECDFYGSVSQIARRGRGLVKLFAVECFIFNDAQLSHNMVHTYNNICEIKNTTNMTQCAVSNASTQAANVLTVDVWLTPELGSICRHSFLQAYAVSCLFHLRLCKQSASVGLNEVANITCNWLAGAG